MTRRPRAFFLAATLCCVPLAAGCGGPELVHLTSNAAVPGVARVKLQGIDGDTMIFVVSNDSNEPMDIHPQAIFLVGPHGQRRQLLGDVKPASSVPRDGTQELRVRFSLDGLGRGDDVQIIFADALTVHGRPVPMPGIRLEIGSD